MADVVGEDQLSAVRAVSGLVTQHGQVGPILHEAPAIVANGNAQRDAKKNAVECAVGDHQDPPLALDLRLALGDLTTRPTRVGGVAPPGRR